ncbi:hypothetical protein NPIL_583181 [Nephila pilipes]|uniref:Uncharacterized protein n=1 Tax=Nephila pilipes TaxID=299642 RepID=A0A8X6MXZ8_NEPPI|nr:hypothetical protein NPIL_583181 [Nephila pilipes]
MKPQLASPLEKEPLVPFEQLDTNNRNNMTPVVHSGMIQSICQALDLSIEFATFETSSAQIETILRSMRKITPLPAIYSLTVLKVCQALHLKAELCPKTERPTFDKRKKKTVPVVHSPAVYYFCRPWN